MVDTCYGLESAYCSGEECYSDCSENGTTLEADEAPVTGGTAPRVKPESTTDQSPSCYDVDVAIIGKQANRLDYIVLFDWLFIVIGNGPSAIFLSFLLSGHVPYFNGSLENTALELKLEKDKRSIIEQASIVLLCVY